MARSNKSDDGGAFASLTPGFDQTFEERFHELINMVGGPVRAAKISGVSKSTLYLWAKSEGKLPLNAALKLSQAAMVSLDFVAVGWQVRPDIKSVSSSICEADVERIPILATSAWSIPEKGEHGPDIGNSFPMSKALLASLNVEAKNIRFIKMQDDGMEPTLLDGSIVLIDTSHTVFNRDAIYALFQPGEIRLKRLSRSVDGSIIISSDNQNYPKERLSAGDVDGLNIAGRVIWNERRF